METSITTSRVSRPAADGSRDDATYARLERENVQLRHAIDSCATVNRTIGALTAIHRLVPVAVAGHGVSQWARACSTVE